MCVNTKTETVRLMGAEDIPVVLLRCEIDACMYVVHRAEAHYVLKLIKLEEAKVRCVF